MIGFLQPWFLLAGGAAAVPLLLHFFFRRRTESVPFPAIRYLLRHERDHARRIRSKLLLLLLRIAIVAVATLAGARLYVAGPGTSHEPTAVAIVLDNSMSTSIVDGGRRLLDTLKAAARASVAMAGHDDVFWVLRAGAPWEPAVRGGAERAREAVDETRSGHAPGNIGRAVGRARELVGQSGLAAQEVHVFTDMQASGFAEPGRGGGPSAVPVVVFGARPAGGGRNRGVASLSFDGGLRPLAGRRTEVAVAVRGDAEDDTVGVRLAIGGRVRAAAAVPAGSSVRLLAGPFAAGRVDGHAEIDSDALAADDRRYFALRVREPTPLATAGAPGLFVTEALGALEEHGRVARGPLEGAALLVSAAGEGLDRRTPSQAAVIVPAADPALLPALNRRLAQAAIPFAYASRAGAGVRVAANHLPLALDDMEVSVFHRIVPAAGRGRTALGEGAEPADGGDDRAAGTARLVVLSSGDPWLVAGRTRSGSYVLFASPLDARSTDVAVSAAMIPLLEWIVARFDGGGAVSAPAGSPILLPGIASRVRAPDGAEHRVDGGQPFLETALTGIYEVLAGDSVVDSVAVNAPVEEIDLAPASPDQVRAAAPGVVAVVEDLAGLRDAVFRNRRGPEPWRALLVLLLALLVAESLVAAPKRLREGRAGTASLRAGGG